MSKGVKSDADADVFADDGGERSRAPAGSGLGSAAVTMVGEVDLKSLEASQAVWRLHVVGVHGGEAMSFHLEEGEHIIGRGQDATVRIDDESISRRHARLVIDDARLIVSDLGSMNGTRVRQRTLKANQTSALAPGESFEIGSLMLVLQRRKAAARPQRRVYDHGYFENRVDEEISRRAAARSRVAAGGARRGAQSLDDSGATLRVDLDGGPGLIVARLRITGLGDNDAITELLYDLPASCIVAEYAPGELEVMFTDLSWDDVENACEALRARVEGEGGHMKAGFAAFPRDGRVASALLSSANAKLSSESDLVVQPLKATTGEGQGAMERLKRLVERVADSDISIVIHGETGVGKEVMAREIHRLSPRKDKPFVGLNCAALTETLLESELFGHERGAFSGAVATKPGLFEVADKGTVFLDEIGEMSAALQAKLLRVLEERTVLRVGGLHQRPIDVRFLAASHKDLEDEVYAGRMRQDLYFRLNGITVEIPPLRERTDELEGLCATFIADACRRNRRASVPTVSKEAMALLMRYAWPGNIRELRNIIERAVLLSGPRITPEHLPVERLQRDRADRHADRHGVERGPASPMPARGQAPHSTKPAPPARPMGPRGSAGPAPIGDADDDPGTMPAMRRAEMRTRDANEDTDPTQPPLPRPNVDSGSLKDAVSDLERQRILDALRACGGNQTKAAEMLGISRRTLVNRLDQYDLPRPRK